MKLKSRIAVFLLAALVIGIAWLMISGRAWFVPNAPKKDSSVPMDYPKKIVGITPDEKLNNLLEQWNKIGENEGYKISGQYVIEPTMTGKIVRIDFFITFLFDYSPQPGEYLGKVNAITGKIIIPTAKIFNPLDKLTMSMDFKPGKHPQITIGAITLQGKQVEGVRKTDINNWTMEMYTNQGELCTDEKGKVTICIPPGEPLFLPK